MSKYKYTSLLSSEYRSVFKSYHSIDRNERQSSLKPIVSHKERAAHSQLKYVPNRKACIPEERLRTRKQKNHWLLSQRESKTSYWRKMKTQPNDYHYSIQKPFQQPNKNNQKLLARIRNKYQTNSTQNLYYNNKTKTENHLEDLDVLRKKSQHQSRTNYYIKNISEINTSDQIPSKRPYIQLYPITQKNNQLKMKVSEINKRRNDIKLQMRVNDIHQISRKYKNHPTSSNQNNTRTNLKAPQKRNYQSLLNANPLQEINPNNMNLKFQKKFLQNITENKSYSKFSQNHDQQNIKTPHFYQAQTKIKEPLDVNLFEKKLQKLAKNTFTDRY